MMVRLCNIGECLRAVRIDKGLSQDDVSKLAGVSTRTIQRVELKNKYSIKSLDKIVTALEIDLLVYIAGCDKVKIFQKKLNSQAGD